MRRHRPSITLLNHPVPVILRARPQPNGECSPLQYAKALLITDDATADCDHSARYLAEEPPEDLAFESSIIGFAVDLEDLAEWQIGGLFNLCVEFDKWDREAEPKSEPDGALAGAAQSDERYRPHLWGSFGKGYEAREIDLQGVGEQSQTSDRNIGLPRLQIGEEARA
jgi:hypothetical protein